MTEPKQYTYTIVVKKTLTARIVVTAPNDLEASDIAIERCEDGEVVFDDDDSATYELYDIDPE